MRVVRGGPLARGGLLVLEVKLAQRVDRLRERRQRVLDVAPHAMAVEDEQLEARPRDEVVGLLGLAARVVEGLDGLVLLHELERVARAAERGEEGHVEVIGRHAEDLSARDGAEQREELAGELDEVDERLVAAVRVVAYNGVDQVLRHEGAHLGAGLLALVGLANLVVLEIMRGEREGHEWGGQRAQRGLELRGHGVGALVGALVAPVGVHEALEGRLGAAARRLAALQSAP
mmetsp:Transcript_191/g.652  ORF Transcript_191/g.652 Transcript_191/m.652 type:complete len:232 (+) Transcript_191:767-1462(+)